MSSQNVRTQNFPPGQSSFTLQRPGASAGFAEEQALKVKREVIAKRNIKILFIVTF
jgi:hypothetical protein